MNATTIGPGAVWDVFESPVGPLTLLAGPRGLSGIGFEGEIRDPDPGRRDPSALAPARRQLAEYFAGERRDFELELDLAPHGRGDRLGLRVWEELRRIPYGSTVTYGELGKALGEPDPRQIGSRVGATPIPIVVPCHRVIGADGSLRGYRGGLPVKEALLALEHRTSGREGSMPVWARGEQLGLI